MLAIVVPYYKSKYFGETMLSISRQTCKDFVLYIGDDASPKSPKDIIDGYTDKINIVYRRFDENLGGKNLVAQWERCIDLTQGEEWIWLFSDDDSMAETCVEEFYDTIRKDNNISMCRFTKKSTNRIYGDYFYSTYKKGQTVFSDFLMDCLDWTNNGVTMPEILFKRSLYDQVGIVDFPLAWGSDKATWMEYSFISGFIYNLESIVYVSFSDVNISGARNAEMLLVKNDIEIKNSVYVKGLLKRIVKKYPDIDILEIKDKYADKILYKIRKVPICKRMRYLKYLIPFVRTKKSIVNVVKSLFKREKNN